MQAAYSQLLKDVGEKTESMLSCQEAILNEDMVFLHEKDGTISTALDLEIQ